MRHDWSEAGKKAVFFIIFVLFSFLLFRDEGYSSEKIVERVAVRSSLDKSVVVVRFNFLFQYVTHSPRERGDYLEVHLKPVFAGERTVPSGFRETVSWEPTESVPLEEVYLEIRSPVDYVLIFRFARSVVFGEIKGSADLRAIYLTLPLEGQRMAVSPERPPLPVKKGMEQEVREKTLPKDRFVINLLAARKKFSPEEVPVLEPMKGYTVYVREIQVKGETWYQARLGFFSTREEALRVLRKISEKFPGPWVSKVSVEERLKYGPPPKEAKEEGPPEGKKKEEGVIPAPEKVTEKAGRKVVTGEKLDNLMREAKREFTAKNYRRAIQLFTKILESPDERYRKEALELLGVARERNNQLAHARAIYESYLQEYPEGPDAERVRQRLKTLLTAYATPREKLRKRKREKEEGKWKPELFGSFSQFYTRDESFTDVEGTVLNISELSSDLDAVARLKKKGKEVGIETIIGYDWDFTDEGESEFRASELNVFGKQNNPYASFVIGRQSYSSGGVLGRFDGGAFSYQLASRLRLNLVGGFPVLSSSQGLETDRWFYGVNTDIGTLGKSLDINLYFLDQRAGSLTDRRAVGGEARVFFKKATFFTLADYDISFRTANILLFVGNWFLPGGTTINTSVDYRRSPLLTLTNATIGQTVTKVEDLLSTYTEGELKNLARDRTPVLRSGTLGVSTPVSRKVQLSLDATVSELSGTPASGGVDAVPGTGVEFFGTFQVIGSSLIKTGDIGIVGVTYSDTSTADRYGLSINTRYPLRRSVRLNPRLRLEYSRDDDGTGKDWTVAPSIRLDLRYRNRATFEIEAGWEWVRSEENGLTQRDTSYFVTGGYRVNF